MHNYNDSYIIDAKRHLEMYHYLKLNYMMIVKCFNKLYQNQLPNTICKPLKKCIYGTKANEHFESV